jgi:hypothetical protein
LVRLLAANRISFLGLLVVFLLGLSFPVWAKEAMPRFMVMIEERNLGTYQVNEAEKVVTEFLMSKGLEVIDAELIKTNVDRDKALQAMNSGPRTAAALGLQFGADVIITGKAIAKGSADKIKDTSFRSYQASVSLKAIRTDTAEVLAMESCDAAKIHVDDLAGGTLAIREATTPLVAKMIPKLLGKYGKTGSEKGLKIQLVIGEVSQVWQVAAIKQLLREQAKGADEIIQRSFVSGVVIFDILWHDDSQSLAEELTLANPGHFKLKFFGITPNKLDAKLVETGS